MSIKVSSRREIVFRLVKALWPDVVLGFLSAVGLALPDVFLLRRTYMFEEWKWLLGYGLMGYGVFALGYDLWTSRFVQKSLGRHLDPMLELAILYRQSNDLFSWVKSMYPEDEGSEDFNSEIDDYYQRYSDWSKQVSDVMSSINPAAATIWRNTIPENTDGRAGIIAAHERQLLLRRNELKRFLENQAHQ